MRKAKRLRSLQCSLKKSTDEFFTNAVCNETSFNTNFVTKGVGEVITTKLYSNSHSPSTQLRNNLLKLFAVLTICFSTSHCLGQDEVLKYEFTAWCNKDYSVENVPLPTIDGPFGIMEIHFKNKGKELRCSIKIGDKIKERSFLFEEIKDIKVSIDSELDYELKVVEYWAKKDQDSPWVDVIQLSISREYLYYFEEQGSISKYSGEKTLYLSGSKRFYLLEEKTEEELPSWMQ